MHAANYVLWYINMGSVDNNILLSITSHRKQKSTISSVKTLFFNSLHTDIIRAGGAPPAAPAVGGAIVSRLTFMGVAPMRLTS